MGAGLHNLHTTLLADRGHTRSSRRQLGDVIFRAGATRDLDTRVALGSGAAWRRGVEARELVQLEAQGVDTSEDFGVILSPASVFSAGRSKEIYGKDRI